VRPHPSQARELIFELGQLHLEAAFVRLGMQREDVQDEARPVDHLGVDGFFECALLGRRELIVGDHDRVCSLRLGRDQFVDFALTNVEVGVDVAAVLPLRTHDFGAGGVGQAGQLRDGFLGSPARVVARVDGNQEGALHRRGQIDHVFGHTGPG